MKKAILITLAMGLGIASAFAQTGRDIAKKVLERPDGDSRQSEMTMTLINKRGSQRVRKIITYSMDVGENKKDSKTIMFFTHPGDVKDTGFLSWTYNDPNKETDQWLYLPAMKKTRRISGSSAQSDYFMGSDLTYEDLSGHSLDSEEHKLLREEAIQGKACWVLQSTPKDKQSIYTKRIIWVEKVSLIPLKGEYYDKLDKLQRTLNASDLKQVDGFWIATKMVIENVQTKHKTILEFHNPKFNISLKESQFTVNSLEKGGL